MHGYAVRMVYNLPQRIKKIKQSLEYSTHVLVALLKTVVARRRYKTVMKQRRVSGEVSRDNPLGGR